jgi:hypothetical protein
MGYPVLRIDGTAEAGTVMVGARLPLLKGGGVLGPTILSH